MEAVRAQIAREEAYRLIVCDQSEISELLSEASRLRDRGKGRLITYSSKVFIPLTKLCRDRCGYCGFRREPNELTDYFLAPEDVLAIAEAGERAGCTEALFVLGERPEQRYPQAREKLKLLGYQTMVDYLRAMCELVLQQTKLLTHSNPGTLTLPELVKLKEVNASLGLMLESVSSRLMQKGGSHERSPSKHPLLRLIVLENAGKLKIAFTTGLLIGIGETPEERVDSLFAIKALQERYGHIQEVIIQNFRAQPNTPMAASLEPTTEEMLKTVAVARLILGEEMNLQVPPNLNASDYGVFLAAGINDWGGISPVTCDHVNLTSPWPEIAELRRVTEEHGFELRARLPIYPEYLGRSEFVPSRLRPHIRSLVDRQGFVKDAA